MITTPEVLDIELSNNYIANRNVLKVKQCEYGLKVVLNILHNGKIVDLTGCTCELHVENKLNSFYINLEQKGYNQLEFSIPSQLTDKPLNSVAELIIHQPSFRDISQSFDINVIKSIYNEDDREVLHEDGIIESLLGKIENLSNNINDLNNIINNLNNKIISLEERVTSLEGGIITPIQANYITTEDNEIILTEGGKKLIF